MGLSVITAPATEPISVSDLKTKYLKDEFLDDTLAQSLIKSAREYCEDYQGKKYITQTLELVLDRFPNSNSIEFEYCSPVQSITSIKYTDQNGIEKTMTDYTLDNTSFINRCATSNWPKDVLQPVNGVRIRFVAGYGDASKVPDSVIWAMVLHIQSVYENVKPEEHARLEKARDSLLGMRRVIPA